MIVISALSPSEIVFRHNKIVLWLAANTTRHVEKLSLKEENYLLAKVAKVIITIVVAILLAPIALVVSCFRDKTVTHQLPPVVIQISKQPVVPVEVPVVAVEEAPVVAVEEEEEVEPLKVKLPLPLPPPIVDEEEMLAIQNNDSSLLNIWPELKLQAKGIEIPDFEDADGIRTWLGENNPFASIEKLDFRNLGITVLPKEFLSLNFPNLKSLDLRDNHLDITQLDLEKLPAFVKQELLQVFGTVVKQHQNAPHVILIVGVNGSGKTTSIAKLASHYAAQGKKVLIAAGDTFRAAAVEQLETWAKRIGVDIVKSQPNSDPSGVVFDALAAAKARKIDIVLIDTAGRLQTKSDLMQELSKVHRICQRQIPNAPHETLLVLDATIGQNALDQAQTFHKFTPLTGIILTKLDGSAKGGIAVAIQKQLNIPIQWIGTGESAEDIAPFQPEDYINTLLGIH